MTSRDCPLCGEPKGLGLATCLPCAGVGADALVFARTDGAQKQGSVASRLRATVAKGVDAESLALAASGHRAIAAVPLDGGPTIQAAFASMGIPVKIMSKRAALAKIPRGVQVALSIMVVLGLVAGLTTAPNFLILTPLTAALILLLAQLQLREPVIEPRKDAALLGSSSTARVVGRQLGTLGAGAARSLLSRVARLARVIERRADRVEDVEALQDLRVLVESAAPVAAELERIHEVRAVLQNPEFEGDPEHREALIEVERAAQKLEGALNDAVQALGRSSRWDAAALRQAGDLPRLARSIEGRMEAWEDALSAVDRLM